MKARILKTEADYEAALAYVEQLMDARPGSGEEEELELFTALIEQYEEVQYPIGLPDPIEAIKFRMDQEGLTRKDMGQYLGSQSKVSEVLNRKRPLSLNMIRALHQGLGIPAEALLQETGKEVGFQRYCMSDFPFNELFKRHYFDFNGTLQQAKEHSEELLSQLFAYLGDQTPKPVLCRRSGKDIDDNALLAWQARSAHLAMQEDLPAYDHNKLTKSFLQDVGKLCYFETGPRLAKELLNKNGIHLIVLPHLPKTYLDGACFISPTGRPIIGMTLRHDRIDNFWFTLIHELAHAWLHSANSDIAFFDEMQRSFAESDDPREAEANEISKDALILPTIWAEASESRLYAKRDGPLIAFAESLRIHPAVVAGRVRWETKDYRIHTKLLGSGQIRKHFPEYQTR